MDPQDRTPGNDAVCFTAGPKGAPFSAGLVHAYLAADRPAPKVTAGISTGALSAAALERCYRELSAPGTKNEKEFRRWNWFRCYLNALSCSPLDVIWNAIPDPVDFFADKPPVVDLSAQELPEDLQWEEVEARQNYYRLVKLGLWFSGLSISVHDVADSVVRWVRYQERYGYFVWQAIRFYAGCLTIALKLFLHVCFSPQLTIERQKWIPWPFPRPLFGWPAWLVALAITVNAACLILMGAVWILPLAKTGIDQNIKWLATLLSFLGTSAGLYLPLVSKLPDLAQKLATYDSLALKATMLVLGIATIALVLLIVLRPGGLTRYLFVELGIARGLLHRYTLHRKLFELFRESPTDLAGPKIGSPADSHGRASRKDRPQRKYPGSMHLLVVAAPLQRMPGLRGGQVWAAPGTPLVEALLAALAVPGMFPPVTIHNREKISQWISERLVQNMPERLDLIDGAAVRQNPVPSLFSWLRTHPEVAVKLCGESEHDAGIHLVYNVPTEAYDPDESKPAPEQIDVVTAAFASLELARRRDTKLECRQTNFISELELWIQKAAKHSTETVQAAAAGTSRITVTPANPAESKRPSYTAFPIFSDEIAPDVDIAFNNNLAPDRDKILEVVAAGCRRSLESLYRGKLKALCHGADSVECNALIRQIAPERSSFIEDDSPGLGEVCRRCTRKLSHRPLTIAIPPPLRAEEFSNLSAAQPRIAFVASGGVFRGAFHIGVIGAMQAAAIRPDLVVGASVGALMGGALSAISTVDPGARPHLFGELCLTFLHVDERVALTRTLKNAAKQLGVRMRCVNLSPAELRRTVRKGTRSDPGYAVCGAPPALIDAISTIFLIPHADTRGIASQFVAGHITSAMEEFWSKVQLETLKHLNIEHSVMGISLIETAARKLLGDDYANIRLDTPQPYHNAGNPRDSISFFSTTSDLNRRRALLLPRDLPSTGSYDFVKAGLSSSAFPVVFSPRQEAEVLPGRGRTDVLFSDGGMFDNLPFFPAIEVLSSVQQHYRPLSNETAYQSLERRAASPDLLIAGALETDSAPTGEADDILEIRRRSSMLKANVKLDSFRGTSELVATQTRRLLEAYSGHNLHPGLPGFMDALVPAAVLKIAPTDREHINGTFAFCSSVGLEKGKVAVSMADGCFQTLQSLLDVQRSKPESLLRTSITNFQEARRIGTIGSRARSKEDGANCPFYTIDGGSFTCPFVDAGRARHQEHGNASQELHSVYKACTGDHAHKVSHRERLPAGNGRNRSGTANTDATGG